MAEIYTGGQRGGQILAYEGHEYVLSYAKKDRKRWVCRNRTACKGAILTNATNGNLVLSTPHDGQCLPDAIASVITKARQKLKTGVRENIQQTVPYVYAGVANEVSAHGDAVAGRLPPLLAVQSSLNRHRAHDRPPLPATLEAVNIPEQFTRTEAGEDFLFYISPDNSVIILGTHRNLLQLGRCTEWSMDGTFDAVPGKPVQLWTQMFTVHGFVGNKLIPLFYMLLKRKSREEYVRVLRIIKDRAAENEPNPIVLDPVMMRCDFESGLLPALRQEFPTANIQGCHFHYTQCIWRGVKRLGLQNTYRDDAEAQEFVKCLFALAFLPVAQVQVTFDLLVAELAPALAQTVDELLAYYRDEWLTRVPLQDWNVWNQRRRTNNNLEGWHSKLGRCIGSNPDLYKFLTELLKEHGLNVTLMAQIAGGIQVNRKCKKYERINRCIATLNERYLGAEITALELVRGIARSMHEPLQVAL